jgi:ATP-dependent helicase HrpB
MYLLVWVVAHDAQKNAGRQLANQKASSTYTYASRVGSTTLNFKNFPIHAVLPELLQVTATHTRLVLEAPPGAGKTTQIPLALLQQDWCRGKKILMLEPRRVAARAAATFMARQLGETVGQTIGYRIRFENKVSANTRVEVVTEGILTRMLQDDPLLENVAAILFDEFHERHLAGDLGLALALDVQAGLREDLRLLVMSATLDGEGLATFLDAQRISSAGRSFPFEVEYFSPRRDESLVLQVRRCLEHALQHHAGDVLVFLPGQRELRDVCNTLGTALLATCKPILLYGDMPVEQQAAALAPDPEGIRRLILATNIAESSVTLPGVRVVIDSGLAREPRFDPNSGFSRLQTVLISQASADQRAGRAGRVAPGHCYRLWHKEQRLNASRTPEIASTDLASLALELAAWGSSELRFADPPPVGALASARSLLQGLGALDEQLKITQLGKRMLNLGTHPRLAAMLLCAHGEEEQSLACDLAALIEARDPLVGYRGDDWFSRWLALADSRGRTRRSAPTNTTEIDADGRTRRSAPTNTSESAIVAITQAAAQWRKRLRCERAVNEASAHRLGDVLLHAYPDRIARQHPGNAFRYQLSSGRMARLHEESQHRGEPWLVVSELRHEQKDSLVLRATPLDEQRLHDDFAGRFTEADSVRWDSNKRALVSLRESRFDQILLSSKPAGKVDANLAARALADTVADLGLDCLPWTESLHQWHARVLCLRAWMPELGLPDISDEALLASRELWLEPAFVGMNRLDALGSAAFADALQSLLDWNQKQTVERDAPVRILVPSGLERTIVYAEGSSPVLAVKLQELFGLAETPRIAGDKVPLTLHLLSPGGKPLQITQDLRSFWERTYPEVKKEMKGRYPKHPWPDDPWNATATHRAKPRTQGP